MQFAKQKLGARSRLELPHEAKTRYGLEKMDSLAVNIVDQYPESNPVSSEQNFLRAIAVQKTNTEDKALNEDKKSSRIRSRSKRGRRR